MPVVLIYQMATLNESFIRLFVPAPSPLTQETVMLPCLHCWDIPDPQTHIYIAILAQQGVSLMPIFPVASLT
jgi:hypothetical protein